jgi:hypothetical protein
VVTTATADPIEDCEELCDHDLSQVSYLAVFSSDHCLPCELRVEEFIQAFFFKIMPHTGVLNIISSSYIVVVVAS